MHEKLKERLSKKSTYLALGGIVAAVGTLTKSPETIEIGNAITGVDPVSGVAQCGGVLMAVLGAIFGRN